MCASRSAVLVKGLSTGAKARFRTALELRARNERLARAVRKKEGLQRQLVALAARVGHNDALFATTKDLAAPFAVLGLCTSEVQRLHMIVGITITSQTGSKRSTAHNREHP